MSAPQIQARTLGQIKLPGTHDSATYALTNTLSQISYSDIQFLWYINYNTAPADTTWPITIPPTAANPAYLGVDLYDFVTIHSVAAAALAASNDCSGQAGIVSKAAAAVSTMTATAASSRAAPVHTAFQYSRLV